MFSKEILIGTKISCGVNRTVDIGDLSLLNSFLWLIQPIHVDAEYAKQSFSGERNLAAPAILAVADGLVHVRGGLNELLEKHGKEIIAYVGIDGVRFTLPVLSGDTLRADVEVIEVRPTKNPVRSVLSYKNKTYNQRNGLVVEYTSRILIGEVNKQ
ncbi:MAG: MaoC/PaaZ C-terminal domain-containing protein [Thermodesulfobacteriota bacterium]